MGFILKVIGWIAPNKIIIILGLLLTGSGYLLIKSYQKSGQQLQEMQQFKQSNLDLEQAYSARLADIKKLQQKIIERQEKRSKIDFDLKTLRRELAGFNDETNCLDFYLGDEFSKLLDNSTSSNN